MSTHFSTITPEQLHAQTQNGQIHALIDVRSTTEYRSGHIPGAKLVPLESVQPEAVEKHFNDTRPGQEETLYITCASGFRARQAAEKLHQDGYRNLALVEGGTDGWKKAGLSLRRCGKALSLERQVQIAIGSLVLMKIALGFSVHELFYALAAFIGIGLIFAGITRWCGLAKLIAQMPWNHSDNCTQQASA
ncbi:MAG: DUF2892 domain-containing protein [Gammaproteobacteria bacterium]|nr:MAG: DUF2892 domain-containing protein [Gammaproteobacteria bacterium]